MPCNSPTVSWFTGPFPEVGEIFIAHLKANADSDSSQKDVYDYDKNPCIIQNCICPLHTPGSNFGKSNAAIGGDRSTVRAKTINRYRVDNALLCSEMGIPEQGTSGHCSL